MFDMASHMTAPTHDRLLIVRSLIPQHVVSPRLPRAARTHVRTQARTHARAHLF